MMFAKKVAAILITTVTGIALQAACAAMPANAQSAAAALQQNEQAACYGVPEGERDVGPLSAQRASSVEVVRDHGVFPKGALVPVGVSIYVRAETGLTREWLGHLVACHMAHAAANGGNQISPLAVPGADVSVWSTGTGFRVTVTSKNSDVAREIVDRSAALGHSTT